MRSRSPHGTPVAGLVDGCWACPRSFPGSRWGIPGHKSPELDGSSALRAAPSDSLLPLTVHRDRHPNQLGVILRVV